jgi:hypothetical protein
VLLYGPWIILCLNVKETAKQNILSPHLLRLQARQQINFLYVDWDNPNTSTAPLPMRWSSMGYVYTSMRYTSMALYFYTEPTHKSFVIFLITNLGINVQMNIFPKFYFYN